MYALRIHEQGTSEGLAYEEAPVPEPGTGDVLVRVHAASFTPTELAWTSTWVDRLGHDRRPVIPGHEVSGTVESLGFGTTGFVGDAVCMATDLGIGVPLEYGLQGHGCNRDSPNNTLWCGVVATITTGVHASERSAVRMYLQGT
jgi:NADPH:quinone reductase-like Zn-dependent oxidoreductase